MKREIKFRAWSKESKKMMPWSFIKSVNNLTKLLTLNHVAVMQYTGLKDRNGVEIYEGDIIKAKNYEPSIHKVIFMEGGFCAFKQDNWGIELSHFYPSVGCQIEVIGNIYENSNLLL